MIGNNTSLLLLKITLLTMLMFSCNRIASAENSVEQDTIKVQEQISIIKSIIFNRPDSAKFYIDTLFILSNKSNYQYGYYNYYNLLGNYFWVKNKMDSAFANFKKSLEFCNDNKPYEKIVALSNIGLIYVHQYNADSANKYLLQTYTLAKENNNLKMAAKALFDLSNLNTAQDNYFDAFKHLVEAESISNKENDTTLLPYIYIGYGILFSKLKNFEKSRDYFFKVVSGSSNSYEFGNLPSTYFNLAQLYILVKPDFDSAIFYIKKAVESSLPHFREFYDLPFLLNMGNIYLEQQIYDSAMYYYKEGIKNRYFGQRKDIQTAIFVNLGTIYLEKNKTKLSDEFLHQGLRLADSLGILSYQKNALNALGILEEKKGNYKQSLQYFKKYKSVDDTINMQEAKNQISSYEIEKYIAEKKLDFELLKQKNILHENILKIKNIEILVTVLFLFILIVLLAVLVNARKKRKKLFVELEGKNKKLTEMNKTKNKFFSIIGHDLKSPFNGMLGLLDLLDKAWDSLADSDKKSYISALLKSSEKTYILLENMLSWGRSQQGLVKPVFRNENIFNLLTETGSLFQNSLVKKKIDFSIDVPGNQILFTDKLILAHIFQNFVSNAIKFTPPNGKVTAFSKEENNMIKICVSDTGIGIPKDNIEHVFDLDFDFNRPGTDNEESSGMGLILCSEYARLLKATLTVESVENKGSTFCLTFSGKSVK